MKINNNSNPIKRTLRFIRVRFTEFKKLIESIRSFGLSSPLIKFRAIQLLVYSSIYPIVKIIAGSKKSCQFCEHFIKNHILYAQTFSFPEPSKSKLVMKRNKDWSTLIEIHINDSYCKDMLKTGMNVVDVGAHIGIYTVLAAQKIGSSGKVISIEPEPENYKQLLENIEINSFKNVMPLKMGLSDHQGQENLYINYFSTGHSLYQETEKDPYIKINVEKLDDLLSRLGLEKIDILKIDAEGAEIPILKGAIQTLKNNPQAKIIVASYHYPKEKKEVREFLQNLGFKTKVSAFDIVISI